MTTTDRLSLINVRHCTEQMILKKQNLLFCRYISNKNTYQHSLFSITLQLKNWSLPILSNVSLQRKNEATMRFSKVHWQQLISCLNYIYCFNGTGFFTSPEKNFPNRPWWWKNTHRNQVQEISFHIKTNIVKPRFFTICLDNKKIRVFAEKVLPKEV